MHASPRKDGHVASKRKIKRVLNTPLLVTTLVAVMVLGVASYAWHSYQVSRTSKAFLRRATAPPLEWVFARVHGGRHPAFTQALKEGFPGIVQQISADNEPELTSGDRVRLFDWLLKEILSGEDPNLAEAAREEVNWEPVATYLHRYSRLDPGDSDTRSRLAISYDLAAKDPRQRWGAVQIYYEALGLVSAHEESGLNPVHGVPNLRRRLAELLLELGRLDARCFASAQAEAQKLLDRDDCKPEGQRLLALALHGQLRSGILAGERESATRVVDALENALAAGANVGDLALSVALAGLYRDENDLPEYELSALLSHVYQGAGDLPGGGTAALQARILRADRNPLPDKLAGILKGLDPQAAQASNTALSSLLKIGYSNKKRLSRNDERVVVRTVRELLADDVMDQLVAAKPEEPLVLLSRYRYRSQYQLPGGEDDLGAALKHGPENLSVLLTAAAHARIEAERLRGAPGSPDKVRESLEKARAYYQRAIDVAPSAELAYLGLGDVYLAEGNVDQAISKWRDGLEESSEESIDLNARLADVFITQGRVVDAEGHLKVLDQTAQKLALNLPRSVRMSLERSNNLLRGRWWVRQGKYREAVRFLERVTTGGEGSAAEVAQTFQAWWLLGGCHAALNQWYQAATAYEEAARLQPKTPQPHLAAARAWATVGLPDKAVRCYEQALALEEDPETCLALARARFQRQARLPKKDQNWDDFNEALAKTKNLADKEKALTGAWRINLLEADYTALRARGSKEPEQGIQKARQLLRDVEGKHPDSRDLIQALVLAYERLGFPEDADGALDKFTRLAGGSAVPYVLRSSLYSRREQYEEAREVLGKALKTLPEGQHRALRFGLVQIDLAQGQIEEAQRKLLRLQKEEPQNPTIVLQLVELAFQLQDLSQVERWEKRLLELEGPDGLQWRYCKARRLLAQAKGTTDPGFAEAERLLSEIQAQRPAWAVGYSLNGLVSEQRGNVGEAIDAYREAVRLGTRAPFTYERLVALLCGKQRFDEAADYLSQLEDQVPSSQRLSRLEILIKAARGEPDRAVEAARRGVESRPQDPLARIWLAERLLAADQAEEAESVLKEAVGLAPTDARTYSALFDFYRRGGQPDRARQTLEKLVQEANLSDVRQALTSAQGHWLLGDREKAKESYRKAERLAPDNVVVQRSLARFLLWTDPAKAEKAWRRVLQLAPRDGSARRTLAAILAVRGGEKEWQEARKLLEEPGSGQGPSLEDRRMLASLLQRRGTKDDLSEATRLLEKLAEDSGRTVAQDRLNLARLYEGEAKDHWRGARRYRQLKDEKKLDDLDPKLRKELEQAEQRYTDLLQKACEQYRRLVARSDPHPRHLALYVDLLLRHGLNKEAGRWLKELEELAPDDLGVMRLEARLAQAQGQDQDIEPLVERLGTELLRQSGDDQQEQSRLARRIGDLYESIERPHAAEQWYRRLLETDPGRYGELALLLARQGKMQQAINICLKAAKSDRSARPAIVLASVLAAGRPAEEDFRLAEDLLSEAIQKHNKNAELLFHLGNVRFIQQRTKEAEELYQRVLDLDEDNVYALNNLAALLSEQPDRREEALKYVDQAIQIAGKSDNLLDTKGMILVYDGKPDLGLECLEEAASAADADPRYHLHLTVAYDQLAEADKARDALKDALDGGLARKPLTRLDQEALVDRLARLVPEEYRRLAMLFAELGRVTDAIRLCIEAEKTYGSLGPGLVLASILSGQSVSPPTAEDFKRAELLLSKAIQEHGDNANLLTAVAAVRVRQQQVEKAIELYEKALKLNPKDLAILNNLATVLSEQPDRRKEALQHIEQAIQIAGPLPALLDTKGTILIHEGKPEKAVELLEAATTVGVDVDPRIHFHLAVAYYRSGQIDKARKALEIAREAGLESQILTPTDRKLLEELEQAPRP